MPVDIYCGGAEHAVMHLFYSRFFCKALRDMGLIDFDEPFTRMYHQGTIISGKQKMSKSRGNVVTPDDLVESVGADAVRAYLMFIGPWDQGGEWNDAGLSGLSRWLKRIWKLTVEDYSETTIDKQAECRLTRTLHQTIKKVSQDISKMHFNTMLAALMEFSNYLSKVYDARNISNSSWQEAIKTLLVLLSPAAPHISEELWQGLGYEYSIHDQSWPQWNETLVKEEEVTLVVQVNGKLRDKLIVPASINNEEAKKLALASPKVIKHLDGKDPLKIIYVAGKLVNIVVH